MVGALLLEFVWFIAYIVGWRWIFLVLIAIAGSIGWATWGPITGRDSIREIVPSLFWSRLSDDAFERPIETLRSTQWQFAAEMIGHRPWFGWGLRNFTPLYKGHMGLWLGHPHNLFLMLLAEIGIPGNSAVLWINRVGDAASQPYVIYSNVSTVFCRQEKSRRDST